MTPSEFLEKWDKSAAAERSNAQSFVIDLCSVLNVDPPHAATSDADRDAYVFEKPVTVPHEGRQHSIGFIDLTDASPIHPRLLAALGLIVTFGDGTAQEWRADA